MDGRFGQFHQGRLAFIILLWEYDGEIYWCPSTFRLRAIFRVTISSPFGKYKTSFKAFYDEIFLISLMSSGSL